MNVYKQFNTNEVISQPFVANKLFNLKGNEITGSNIGIDIFSGLNLTTLFDPISDPITGIITQQYSRNIYNNIRQLYYSNNVDYYGNLSPSSSSDSNIGVIRQYTGSYSASYGRFENYLQTSLYYPKYFPTASQSSTNTGSISVISIPSRVYGNHIVPLTYNLTVYNINLTDDGEGNILENSQIVGNIFYSHGIVVITTGSLSGLGNPSSSIGGTIYGQSIYGQSKYGGSITGLGNILNNLSMSFSSSINIYENRWNCSIKENEFNFSQNPSIISGSGGNIYDYITSSSFNPYITTIGLYNNNKELLAVAKLAQPIQTTNVTDLNIYVSIDM